MMDSFFKTRFNAAKCKTMLKLTIPRIKLLRNRREVQLKQMRKEIAKLLETGQEATARIRVEHIIREEKMMAAQEIVELFCELIAVRLPIIEAQRECPLDLKEAISSVCFAAPRCADLPELLQVQILFAGKYGKEFIMAATELMPECGVNRQLVELLSVRAPAPEVKLNLLKEIAEEHQLDWDPTATESDLLRKHEDLLNGPTQFVCAPEVPLPKEKQDDTTYTVSEPPTTHEKSDSDSDFDIVDFPEVPTQPLQPNRAPISTPMMLHFPESALSDSDDQEESNSFKPEGVNPAQEKQFLPFISPPSQSSERDAAKEHNPPPPPPITKMERDAAKEHNPPPPPPITKMNDGGVDLQDVLAAASAAAESAERAAAAARSAASIAQLRISELTKRRSNEFSVPNAETDIGKQNSNGDSCSASMPPTQIDSSSSSRDLASAAAGHRQPSMDDELYFSYPNLFKHQGSDVSAHSESPRESK